MKKGIHPEYKLTRVICACGNTWVTRSTKFPEIRLEVCNKCHPFYKGELTRARVSTKGRLEKFLAKYGDKYAQGKK